MAETVGAIVFSEVGLGAAASFLIGGTGITLGAAVGGAILVGGAVGLMYLNRPKRPDANPGDPSLPPPEAGHQPLKQTIPPRIVGLGRVRLAGSYVLFEANSGIAYTIIAFHHGEIAAIVGYYLHDDVITLNAGVVDVQGDGRYGSSKITIKTRMGLSTETAYSEVTSPLSTIWTSAHRGDGLASLLLIANPVSTADDFPTIYPRGLPIPSVVADCTAVFDPRDDDQDIDDPSTWVVSSNPVLQVLFFLTDADRGMGFDWDTLIEPVIDDLMAEADLCDELTQKKDDSYEKRYESNGSYSLDSDPQDVINSILDAFDGWISENGDGTLALKVGAYRSPSITLEAKHIRGVQLQYDVADEEAVNELTIDYTDPLLDYKTAPGQPWRDETDISERGKVLSQRLALPWVYSHSQARRLAKRRMAQFRAPLRGTITTTLYGLRALGERWIKIEAPELPDLSDIVVEVRGMTVDLLNAQCSINFVSINPNEIDAWDPDTEEGSAPTIPAKLVAPAPPVPQNLAKRSTAPKAPPAFALLFDDPGRPDLTFQVAWRISGGGAFTEDARTTATIDPASGRWQVEGGVFSTLNGHNTDVKLRSFAPSGPGSAYSTPVTFSVP